MKKILLFIGMIFTLMALTYAQTEPTITNVTEHGVNLVEDECFSDGTDVFCVDTASDTLYKYDVSTENLSAVGTFTTVDTPPQSASCTYYSGNSYAYCMSDNGASGQINVRFMTDLSVQENISDFVDQYPSSSAIFDCETRPNNAEIWCWGEGNTEDNVTLRYYNITGDSWINVKNLEYPDTATGVQGSACVFADEDTFICGGGEESGKRSNSVFVYDVQADSETFGSLAARGTGHTAIYTGNIVYFVGMDDFNGGQGVIVWYDPITNFSGNLTDDYEITGYGGWANIGDTLYAMSNYYTSSYDEFYGVITYDWTPATPPAPNGTFTDYTPAHSSSDVVGVVIDFVVEYGIQMIVFAAPFAIATIFVLIYPYVRRRL